MDNVIKSSVSCQASMKLLGDYWTLRIIDALRQEDTRFCELQRRLDDVNPVTLSTRLRRLEEAKLIARSEETLDKVSVVYSLTSLGDKALPVVDAVNSFSSTT